MNILVNSFIVSLLVIMIIGYTRTQNINSIDDADLKNKLNEQFPGLGNFNESGLVKAEEVEKTLKEKCEKNGADPSVIDNLKNQKEPIKKCVEQYINATKLQEELEEAKKTGSMDEVFGKYCAKYEDIHGCVTSATEDVKKCLNKKETDAFEIALKSVGDLKEFLCYKDGDRIAMFVAEGGVECLEERKDGIQNCVNETLGSRIPDDLSPTNLPTFLFTENDCSDFDKIRICINTELEKCSTNTPANLMDAFFKYLKKHTPCKSVVTGELKSQESSAYTNAVSFFAILSIFIVRLF